MDFNRFLLEKPAKSTKIQQKPGKTSKNYEKHPSTETSRVWICTHVHVHTAVFTVFLVDASMSYKENLACPDQLGPMFLSLAARFLISLLDSM